VVVMVRSWEFTFDGVDRRPSRVRTRARKLLSLLQVLALALATFVFVPLMVRAEPADDFVATFDNPGANAFHCQFTGQEVVPGSTAVCRMRVGNGSAVDASFYIWVNEETISVTRCPDMGTPENMNDDFRADGECVNGPNTRFEVSEADPDWETFVGFWEYSVTTRPMITRSLPEDRDLRYDPRYVESCPKKLLSGYDGGPDDFDVSRMCDMGVIRALQSNRSYADSGEQAYERQYVIGMTERDTGQDQTRFRGWEINFDMTVRMQVPATDACPTTRVNGICASPVYQRR
jgi:hypothetical protein